MPIIVRGRQSQDPQRPPAAPPRPPIAPPAAELAAPAPAVQPQEPLAPPPDDPVGDLRPLLEQDQSARQDAPVPPAPVQNPLDPVGDLRPLLEDDQRKRRQQAEDFALASFGEAVKSDPAVRAEAQSLAEQLGVDPDTAEKNRDVLRQFAQVRDQRLRTLAGANPVLARHMADIEFARIAHDDTDNLGAWERLFKQWDVGAMEFEQGALGEKVRANQATPQDLERLAFVRSRLRAMPQASGFLENTAKILGQQAASLPQVLKTGTAAAIAAGGMAAIAGQMGPQVMVPEELATVPAATLTGFAFGSLTEMAMQSYRTEGGNAYLEMLDAGYDRGAASKAAVGVGVANAMLEVVGVKLLAKGAGITAKTLRETLGRDVAAGVAAALTRPTMGQALKQFAKGYATGLGGEVFTEVAQEGVNIAAEEIARRFSDNPDALNSAVTRGEIVQRLVDTAVQTTQGMALLAAPGPTMQLFRDQRRAAAAEHTAQFWKELGTARDASKVIPRNVGAAERFLAAAAKGTQAAEIYIDGEAFGKVLNQADWDAADKGLPKPSEQLEKALPGIINRIAVAAGRGEDVVIPTAEVGTKLAGTPLYQQLVPHLRLDADAMSLADAEVFRQQEQQRTAEAEKALAESDAGDRTFAESARSVEESIRQQLVAAGRDTATATTEAKFYRDMVIVKAQQLGMLPAEFHALKPLKVKAGEVLPDGRVVDPKDPNVFLQNGQDVYDEIAKNEGQDAADAVRAMHDLGVDTADTHRRGDKVTINVISPPGDQSVMQRAIDAGFEVKDLKLPGGLSKGMAHQWYLTGDPAKIRSWAQDLPNQFGSEPEGFFSKDRSIRRGVYRPADATVFLTKSQNASTFLHELGHHYLELLADLALQKAHPEIVDDFRALTTWFGLADEKAWQQLSFAEKEKHHEQFARSFETWLWDGKAPTQALEGVFARVARWIRQAYQTIVGEINAQYRRQFGEDLPALTPEVRSVMGRMVASRQDIEQASAVLHMADTFESQDQAGVDDATWAEHEALVGEASDQALADHTRSSLREMQWFSRAHAERIRELQKQHDATRARVRDEVEAELQGQPVFRARRWLETGDVVGPDGIKAALDTAGDGWAHTEGFDAEAPAAPPHKLQTEAVQALLPPGTDTKALGGRGGILAPDGVLPDVAARVFGFETGEDLVRALLQTPKLEAAIDARTDARMLEEYSDLADPKRRELAVLRALHNESRTRLIAVDLRTVAKTLGPVRLLVKAAREQAKRLLAKKPVSQINPREHLQAEAKAAKAFSAALKAGDMAAAAAAQQRRLLQHEIAKAASAIMDEIDEGLQDLGRFVGTDEKLATTRDIDLVYAGRALAAAFGIGPQLTSSQERELVAKARQKLRTDYRVLAGRVDSLLDDQASGTQHWQELPLDTFRELVETGQALWTEAGKARWLEHENRRQLLASVVQDGVAQIEALPKRSETAEAQTGKTPSPLARFVLKGWNILANLKRFEHWAWFMDGGKLGWFAENFVLPLRTALGRYWRVRADVIAKLHPQVMAIRKAAGPLWDADIAVPEADLASKPLVLRGKKELIGLLAQAGSHSNLAKALVPYGFALDPNLTDDQLLTGKWDAFLARMFQKGVLTAADVDFVRFVWDVYKELLPEDQKTHKALYGFEFRTIELRELHTPFGTLSGGYVPAFVDQDKVQAPRPSSVLETLEGEEQNFQYSISTGRGHTLARNPNYLKPLALDIALQVQHIDKQLRFTYLQPAIAATLKILRNRDFSGAMTTYDREAINSVILPMLENAALQASSRPSGMPLVDAVAGWLRSGASLAALGFNFTNSVLQLTGFSNSAGAVRAPFMRAAAMYTVRNPRAAVRIAMQKSTVMRERLDQTTKILRDDIGRVGRSSSIPGLEEFARGVKKVQQVAGRIAFWPQRMLQGAVDVVTWHAANQQYIADSRVDGVRDETQLDADAIAHADGVVKRTQGSGNPEDLAAYESGTPLMKLMTQFGSYSNVVLNQVLSAQSGWSPKLRAIAWAIVLPAFAEASMRALLQGVPDDDKDGERDLEEIALLYTKSLARNVTGLVPAAGPMLLSLAESDGKRVLASPASTLLQQAWQGISAAAAAGTGADATAAEVRAIGTLLTVMTGLPIVPVTRAIGYDVDVGKGRVPQPTGPGDYLRGLFVGR